jgi:hypothetical protein
MEPTISSVIGRTNDSDGILGDYVISVELICKNAARSFSKPLRSSLEAYLRPCITRIPVSKIDSAQFSRKLCSSEVISLEIS